MLVCHHFHRMIRRTSRESEIEVEADRYHSHRRIHDRWLAGCTRWSQGGAKFGDWVCGTTGRYRGCGYWTTTYDGATATTNGGASALTGIACCRRDREGNVGMILTRRPLRHGMGTGVLGI